MRHLFIAIIFLSLVFTACKKENTATTAPANTTAREAKEIPIEPLEMYAWVDQLRVRSLPTLNSRVFVEMVEGDTVHVAAVKTERVHVGVPQARPVDELDAQLEGALSLAYELIFIQVQQAIEQVDLGNGGFTDADRADLFGFHQDDFHAGISEDLGYCGGGHPAGGTASDDHDFLHGGLSLFVHVSALQNLLINAEWGGIRVAASL